MGYGSKVATGKFLTGNGSKVTPLLFQNTLPTTAGSYWYLQYLLKLAPTFSGQR
jgi:hypothetical protein